MDVSHDATARVVVKRAGSAEERRQLDHEAALLGALAHPGVVQLVGVEGSDPPDGLVLRRVPGGDLRELGSQSLEVVAGLGAAIATTVADLHDLRIYHGAIEASHVLLDDHGGPVLCSFGRAQRDLPRPRADVHQRQDVRALARLLLAHLEGGAPTAVVRTLRRAAGPGRQRRCGDARWLARRLAVRVAGARLPDMPAEAGRTPTVPAPVPAPPNRPRAAAPLHGGRDGANRRRRRAARTVVIVASLGFVGLAGVVATGRWSSSASPPRRQLPCPPADSGCGPVPTPAGVLTTSAGRYLLGEPEDVVVLGRWRCDAVALPAVLRPQTGELWAFAAWPKAGRGVAGQLVASHVRAARSLRVLVGPSGCDRIEVERRGRPPLIEALPR